MGGFVHLHLHSEYSLLDGACAINKIADKALSLGQSAVAITDHGVMYGAVDFYDALVAKGVKPIIGCEVYVAERSRLSKEGKGDSSGNHLILLCKNDIGYKNLCYMVSKSFIDGFYSKPRVDMELIRDHSEGLIALSACLAGKIPQLILSGSMSEAERYALEMKEIFGDDFYLEIQNHGIEDERRVNFGIRLISEKHGIPMVATNDVHYLDEGDAEMQATLMCIQMNTCITDGRPLGFENNEFYFKAEYQMRELFSDFPGAVDNTVIIADKCSFAFDYDKLHLPDFKAPDGKDHKETLRADAYEGLRRKIDGGIIDFSNKTREEYTERIEYELSVIDRMGFNAYFLIVSDFVNYAKSKDIPVGPGRGSGAGSLVAFLVGITDVDPLRFDLLFERFLNPERVSMPDFDIDFCYTRREEVIDYVKRRYGEDKVAQIVTFGTLAARAAIRDVGRALGMPYSRVDTVAKLIPRQLNVTIEEALQSKELSELYRSDNDVRKLINISKSLEGMPRHASTHAAGIVITELPTYNYVPLSYSGTGVVTQYTMNNDAKLGLVKFDFLGLRYLTVIHDAESEIKKNYPDFDITKIPLDDEATFRLLTDANTDGVFQLESGGMKQTLQKLKPGCLEDIIAVIALYRPGPMDSIDDFIKRKHGEAELVYKTPMLEDILKVTYGCIVYQEQVMQIFRSLAGYTFARADIVRRAMSKKKTEVMMAERQSFIEGCAKNGIGAGVASEIFDEMASFAKYAFNKSHATAYGVISYRTAYLKAHYPAEYFSALFSSVLGNPGKIREYIADAAKMGVRVLPPDINLSNSGFSVIGKDIRFGLLAIKNVGHNFTRAVETERKRGAFKSFDDFVHRMIGQDLNKRTLESFIKCGVFDSLGVPRSSLIASYDLILESEQNRKRNNISGQMDLFSLNIDSSSLGGGDAFVYPDMPEFSLRELLILEKENSGMYFSGHMIDSFSHHISSLKADSIRDIYSAFEIFDTEGEEMNSPYKDGSYVRLCGIIMAKSTKTLKNGDTMAFITLEDSLGEIEVVVFAKTYAKYKDELELESGVLAEGRLSVDDNDAPKLLLSKLSRLLTNGDFDRSSVDTDRVRADVSAKVGGRLFIKVPDLSEKVTAPILRLSSLNPGTLEVILYDSSSGKYTKMKNITVSSDEKLIDRLKARFGKDNVVIKE